MASLARRLPAIAAAGCALTLLGFQVASASETNYCHDPETNKTWKELLVKGYDNDRMIQLYALRDGLCDLVDEKVLTVKRATLIFERERQRILNKEKRSLPRGIEG